MADIPALIAANARRWSIAKLTRGPEFMPVANRLVAAKARFQAVEQKTNVPWFVIAVIKERESGPDPNWLRNIAQGDPWDHASVHEPAGRGPFPSWDDAAYDAMVRCAPYAATWKDWTPGGLLTLLEEYNGLGYANGPHDRAGNRYPPQASPYVWSGTDQYRSGKYIADGVFDASVVDKQLGCAGVLLAMRQIDPSISMTAPVIVPAPSIPQQSNLIAALIQALRALFTRK